MSEPFSRDAFRDRTSVDMTSVASAIFMGARGQSSLKKYTFLLLTRALMSWLPFIKLREILVGIIVGLFLAILFWSGDRYATQPKTGSDSGEFNLRLGLLLLLLFFFLGRARNRRVSPKEKPGTKEPLMAG